MKTRSTTLFVTFIFLLLSFNAFSNEPEEKPLRTFQLSLFPVIGTDGINSADYRYQLSLNLFAGVTGGVEGLELGGFANINNGRMKGLQMAGFTNIVNGEVEGLQAAGFLNIATGKYNGIGMSGFANITADETQGIFGAGFGNFSRGNLQGIQLAGFMNVAQNMQGIQSAGFMNIASEVQGIQAAGFMNVASDIQGIQVAGFLNVADVVDGLQLGFINVADSISGIPIGFLSIVKKGGYHRLEAGVSDVMHYNVSAKIGVRQFYNIFSFSSRLFSDAPLSGFGYGIGTEISLSPVSSLNIEGHTTSLFDFNDWNYDRVNVLSELRTIFSYSVSDRISIFAGPVLYNQIIEEDPVTGIEGLLVSSYDFYTTRCDRFFSQWWIGGRAGVSFRIN